MTRSFVAVFAFILLASTCLAGTELPVVLQPNKTVYSAAEVDALSEVIATLEGLLSTSLLASLRTFTPNEWDSGDFAAYTAGILTSVGYETVLVSGTGWEDGTHTWILVGVPVGATTAWIPAEASPDAGRRQPTLGYIPSSRDATGDIWFEERYLGFHQVLSLPSNLPPTARIDLQTRDLDVHVRFRCSATDSYDPDGEIVLYLWNFGDGKSVTSTTGTIRYEFRTSGQFVMSLEVIDNRGTRSLTSRADVLVAALQEDIPDVRPANSCGCG